MEKSWNCDFLISVGTLSFMPMFRNLMISSRSKSYDVKFGLQSNKTCLRGFQQSETQTSLFSYRDQLES